MRDENVENEALQKEIKDLQREIGKLSMLLALKKLESDHPALEKLATDIEHARNRLRSEGARLASHLPHHCGDGVPCKALKTFAEIMLIGALGYLIASLFGWLGHEDARRR